MLHVVLPKHRLARKPMPAAPPRQRSIACAPRSRAYAANNSAPMSTIIITNTRPEHIPQLVLHQQLCFPTLTPEEWMRAEHFESQLRLFPAGQHVALDGEHVVGQSSTFRISGAIALEQHGY